MTPQEKAKEAKKRYKRIYKEYQQLREEQPLATHNAIIMHIAAGENVSPTTVTRALDYCRK